jgi:hypothetical protein
MFMNVPSNTNDETTGNRGCASKGWAKQIAGGTRPFVVLAACEPYNYCCSVIIITQYILRSVPVPYCM